MLKYQYLQSNMWSCGAASLMCAAAELGVGRLVNLGNSIANSALETRFPAGVNLSNAFRNLESFRKAFGAVAAPAGAASAGSAPTGAAPAGAAPAGAVPAGAAPAGAAPAGAVPAGAAPAGAVPAGAAPAGAAPAGAAPGVPASMGSPHPFSLSGLPTHITAPNGLDHDISDISLDAPYAPAPSNLNPLQICWYIENTIFIATRARGESICPGGSWVSGIAYTAFAMGLNVEGIYLTPKLVDIVGRGQATAFGLVDYADEKSYLERRFRLIEMQPSDADFPRMGVNSRRFLLVGFAAQHGRGLHWIMIRPDNSIMNPGRFISSDPLPLGGSLISDNPLPLIFSVNHSIVLGIDISSKL